MKSIITGILLICLIISNSILLAQQGKYDSEPPWVKGHMPKLKPNDGYYKVIHVDGLIYKLAKKEAKKELIDELLATQGFNVDHKSVHTSNYKKSSGKKADGTISFSEETRIESKGYKAVFANVDEYYTYEDGLGDYWVLYFVSSDASPIEKIPNIECKLDNGAWRSIIVPGWAQLYQKRYGAGLAFLGGEAAILSTAFYFNSRYNRNYIRSLEASSVSVKQAYRDRANKYQTYSLITFGAAAGWYVFNLIDAFTSKKGILQYDYGKMDLALNPYIIPSLDNNMCMMASIHIRF